MRLSFHDSTRTGAKISLDIENELITIQRSIGLKTFSSGLSPEIRAELSDALSYCITEAGANSELPLPDVKPTCCIFSVVAKWNGVVLRGAVCPKECSESLKNLRKLLIHIYQAVSKEHEFTGFGKGT